MSVNAARREVFPSSPGTFIAIARDWWKNFLCCKDAKLYLTFLKQIESCPNRATPLCENLANGFHPILPSPSLGILSFR